MGCRRNHCCCKKSSSFPYSFFSNLLNSYQHSSRKLFFSVGALGLRGLNTGVEKRSGGQTAMDHISSGALHKCVETGMWNVVDENIFSLERPPKQIRRTKCKNSLYIAVREKD